MAIGPPGTLGRCLQQYNNYKDNCIVHSTEDWEQAWMALSTIIMY